MQIKRFTLPLLEPGTFIAINPSNGGGYWLSCPNCCMLERLRGMLCFWPNGPADSRIDTMEEMRCSHCGYLFVITQNQITERHTGQENRPATPPLKTYGKVTA